MIKRQGKKFLFIALFLIGAGVFVKMPVFAQDDTIKIKETQIFAGEIFGEKVSMSNYHFARAAAQIFGGSGGGELKTPQELEAKVWEDLIFSYEAYRQNISVTDKELDKELSAILESEKVKFDRKKDKAAYAAWIQERIKEPVDAFENQLKHLIQLQKLRDQVREGLKTEATADEAYQKYLNEYNTLSVEFVQFDDVKAAGDYFEKMKNGKKWGEEAKKNPKFSVKPGFVSLEFLIEMWKFPKEDAYAMLSLPVGSVYKPIVIYKGYAVCHILEKRVAEKDKFKPMEQSYIDKVKRMKQYEGLNAWIKQLKQDAHLKVYMNNTRPQ